MLKKFMVALMTLTVLFSLTSPTVAAVKENPLKDTTNCSDCLTEIPDSVGSKKNIKKTEEIVYSSEKFINETRTMSGKFDKNQAIITAPDKKDNTESSEISFLTLPVLDSEDGLSSTMFVVNLQDNKVVNIREVFVVPLAENKAQVKIEDNGELIGDFTVTPDKVKNNLTSIEQSYEEVLNSSGGVQTFGWCESAVYTLKTLAGGAQCIITCGALGFATAGIAGVGCSLVCALLLNHPIDVATRKICN